MPNNLTTAQIRRLVTDTAKRLADDMGRQLSDAALRGLLDGSEAYFAEGGSRNVNIGDLEKTLAPIVRVAVNSVRRDEGGGRRTLVAGKGKKAIKAFRTPLLAKKPVRKKDVREAIDKATCHMLWFC
ncbi:MAG TPA: hypothetical protein VGM26_09810 [Rhizomicrobium sp.]|jgi:hypothetical protein